MKKPRKGKFRPGHDPRRVKGYFRKRHDPRRHRFTKEDCAKGGFITTYCYIHGPWAPPFPPYLLTLAREAWNQKPKHFQEGSQK